MSAAYVRAAQRIGRVLLAVEQLIDSGRFSGDPHELRRRLVDGVPSDEELLAAMDALLDLGVVVERGETIVVDARVADETAQYRRGVRDALHFAQGAPADLVDVCVALPTGLAPEVCTEVHRAALDLRAGILDIVTRAEQRVVLSAPFWDGETVDDLGSVLLKRADAGIRVELLTRRIDRGDSRLAGFWSRATSHASVAVYTWERPQPDDAFGSQTFHFKCAISDSGRAAYVGSANLTRSGLRSRMEMGVVVSGLAARRIARVVDVALSCATRVTQAPQDTP